MTHNTYARRYAVSHPDIVITSVRLNRALIERMEALVPALQETETMQIHGVRATRSHVLREAILRGLEVLESQAKEDTAAE